MKRLDELDEELMHTEQDPERAARKKVRDAYIKKGIAFLVRLAIVHVGALVLYSLALSSVVASAIRDELTWYKNAVLVFSLIAITVLSFFANFELSSDGDQMRAYLKEAKPSLKDTFLRSRLILGEFSAIYFLFQLPICVFYSIAGYYYVNATALENFYIMDIGLLELTGIGIVGILMNTLFFAAMLFLMRHITYKKWKKSIE